MSFLNNHVLYEILFFICFWGIIFCKCFDPISGKYLDFYVNSIGGRGEDECKASCLTANFQCKSAQYNKETKVCFLNEETHLTQSNYFESSNNYIYWIRNDNCQKNCYFEYSYKMYLLDFNTIKMAPVSSFECLEECLSRSDIDCKSIDYYRDKRVCTLSVESKNTQPSPWLSHIYLEHFHKVCFLPELEYPCFKQTFNGKYLNNYVKEYYDVTDEECRELCLSSNFYCKSAQYKKKDKICYLNDESHMTTPVNFISDENYVYWLRDDECAVNCYLKEYKESRIADFHKTIFNSISKIDCFHRCFTEKQFICLSLDYNKNNKECILSSKSSDSASNILENDDSYNHYDRICINDRIIPSPCFNIVYEGKYLNNYDTIIQGQTEDDCRRSCLISEILCKSAQYDRLLQICYLNVETHISTPKNFEQNLNFIYWMRDENCDLDCYFQYYIKRYLLGSNTYVFRPFPEMKCMEQCFKLKNPECLSIDYHTGKKQCTISVESKDTEQDSWLPHGTIEHYHKVCPKKFPCFKYYEGKYLNDKLREYRYFTEENCVRLCLSGGLLCK